jgi:TolA-binding protein
MTRFDLHPEDLLERAARGAASPADLARLEQHLAECAVCRVERALAAQAASDAAPRRDEKLLVARLKREVEARLASPGARSSRRKGALVVAAFAAVAVAGVAAAATLVVARRAPPPLAATATAVTARAPLAQLPTGAAPVKAEAARSVTGDEAALVAPGVKQAAESVPERAHPPPVTLEPTSSSELFSRANQARRDGKVTEAARLYRALQERHSGTSEELVSRVTLGRLLLDRLGDSRGALVQFNSYLASPGGGALREEAMVGRALALGRMGRAAEERAAWQALLDAWPKSTHRRRAQARLAELGGVATDAPAAGRAGTGPGAATGKGGGGAR